MTLEKIGFIAIGRNEGERFKRCLRSLKQISTRIVYVDSGSADDSVEFALQNGANVVELPGEPFTAARARNAGFARFGEEWPDAELVMFIDGDCELIGGFAEAAAAALRENPDIGVVTGRCRERHPDATIYNRLCDMEWDGPVGDIDTCGGIFMTRAALVSEIGGFNASIIAGEDDEFCVRVRTSGARVHRIARDMCLHDANMRRFGQWWLRSVRAGHAYAQVGEMHPDYCLGARRRAWGWGLVLPAAILGLAPLTHGWSALLLILYPLSFIRTGHQLIKKGASPPHARLHAGFLTLAKFPNLIGLLNYRRKRLMGLPLKIYEYK